MTDIAPLGSSRVAPVSRSATQPPKAAAASTVSRDPDRVELSDMAQLLSRLNELPDVRQDVVDRVREQIANGSYETPEKVDAALDELLQDLA